MEMKMSTRQLTAILITLLLSFNSLFAQTEDSTVWDGKIYVKIFNHESKTFPNYSGGSIASLPEEIKGLASQFNITKISRAFPSVSGDINISKIYLFEFTEFPKIDLLMNKLQGFSYIEYAEKVPYNKIFCTTEDAIYPNYWTTPAQSYHLNLVNACGAWGINLGSPAVNVAIVDNEFNVLHPDLLGKITLAFDVADLDANVAGPTAAFDHGTHVAGIAGASTNNNIGIASLGRNISLMVAKASTDVSGGTAITNGYDGIVWAVNNGADVVSCSWGGTVFSATEQIIINWADGLGVLVVAAAGNDNNSTLHYPAAYNNVFAVGNTDQNDLKHSSSCFGNWVDICAPGTSILSTLAAGGYGIKTGTSMATPMVSALCGLILSNNPAYSPVQITNCITSTAVNIDGLNPLYTSQLGAGRIDAQAAMVCSQTIGDYVAFTATPNNICVNGNINFTDNSVTATAITSWNWTFTGGVPATSTLQNPVINYPIGGTYSVTLSITTGSGTFIQFFDQFVNVIDVVNFAPVTVGDVCAGSEQQLNVTVAGRPPYTIDYNVNGGATQTMTYNANIIPLYILTAPVGNSTVTITSVTSNGVTCASNEQYIFNTIVCCPNLAVNGDFEAGNVAFTSDNGLNCGVMCPGHYCVNPYSGLGATWTGWNVFSTILDRNNSLYIDGRSNPAFCNTTATLTPFATPGAWFNFQANFASADWSQVINFENGQDYMLSFFTTRGHPGPTSFPFVVGPLNLRVRILDATLTPVYTSPVQTVPYTLFDTWQQTSFNIPAPVAINGAYTVVIEQFENFAFNFYDYLIDDITLQAVNDLNIAVTATPTSICSGASSTLSTVTNAVGGTYSWTALPLPDPTATTASIIVSPPVTTSYTVTVTDPLTTCAISDDLILTVNPLPIVTFGSIPNPCSGGAPITLTTGSPAGGVYSGPNVSGGIFTPPVVTSSTPYIITYTFTDGTTGCTNSTTQTITVDVCAGPCGVCNEMAPSGILSVSPAQYNVYCITTPMTISGTVTIALSEVRIAPTITITVPSGSTLNIYGSHLYSCADMWQGIIVQPGGRINVINWSAFVTGFGLISRTPMIEDARTAIDIQAGSTLTTGILNIRNATFNRNEYSIKINGYSPILVPYPFSIISSVFTCRDIGFVSGSLNWPLTNTVRTAPTPPSPLQTPYINSAIYFESTAAAFLKSPFLPGLSKSRTAIQLNSIGTVVNPATTPTWYEIKIGASGLPRYNVFDNHVICIDAFNSNFTCVNNIFQNTIGGNNSGGIAINANAKDLNCRAQVIAGTPTGNFNNKFFDCSRSINTTNYFENTFKYCDVRSTQAGPLSPPPPAPPTATNPLPLANHRGQHGFFVLTNRFRVIDMSDNKLYNVENGITFNANFGPYNIGGVYSSASGQYSGQVNVDRNEIAPHLPTYTIVDQYVRSAISLSNVIASGLQVIAGTDIRSNSNTISNVHRAVFTTNWAKKNVITNSNIITLRTDLYSNIATQFGVAHVSNSGGTAFGNSINANTVTGTSVFANVNIRGILTSRCTDQRVACNGVNGTTHGIEFASTELNTKFDNNSMTNHKYGYVLSSNGIIGVQGNNSNPSDNGWFGTWTAPNYKTATLTGSSSLNSKMFVRTSSVSQFNPDPSGITILGTSNQDEYLFANILTSLVVSTTPVPYLGCAVIVGGGGGGGMPGSAIALLEDIAQDNISFVKNPDETKYINKNQLYRLLKADPSLTASSIILQDFYTASVPTVRETYTNIEDDIALGDIVNSQSKTTALAPVNTIEDNYKTFFNTYLKHQTDTILESDSIAIVDMANGCPFTDGDVVYQARALYNSIYRTNIYFEDNCPEISERSFNQVKNAPKSSFDVLVYPNPNTGSFSLVPFSSDIKELNIKVIDVNGKVVYEKTIDSGDRMFNLSLDAQNGVYMLFVNNPKTNENIVKRIVIQK